MLRRLPTLAWMFLATMSAGARAGDTLPPPAPTKRPADCAAAAIVLGAPIAPKAPSKGDTGVGLRSLDANGGTLAALRSDGRILVVTAGVERVVEPPENGEAFHAPIVAGDATPVAVTTRGRIALLEAEGTRFLALSIQRSAKPVSIPNSTDVVLGSENGSIRRLVRSGASPRLVDVVDSGDAPVGALAVSLDRVVYARLDGVVLGVAIGGGDPRVLARPVRAVRAIRFAGDRAFAAIGGDVIELGKQPSRVADPSPRGALEPPDVDSVAVSADGLLLAHLAAGAIEVGRLADGTRVRSEALLPRRPSALAWSPDGRTLWVATTSDARPFAISVGTR